MARLLHRSGAPRLKAECKWGPDSKYRLDFADPERRLLIEVDGYAWHSTPDQMRRDLRRRNELNRAGWTILVYTWKDVTGEEERVIQEIADSYTKRAS
jgi:very-short-patch-repair endonuclease